MKNLNRITLPHEFAVTLNKEQGIFQIGFIHKSFSGSHQFLLLNDEFILEDEVIKNSFKSQLEANKVIDNILKCRTRKQ